MKSVAYIRVSTSQQAENGFSLDNQREAIVSYCRAFDLPVPETVADEGLSGRSISKRPGIRSVLERLPEIDHLLVYSLTRLGRNMSEVVQISNLCEKHGVTLHILDLRVDTSTASGKLFFQIMASMGEFESNLISERIRAGQDHNRRNGLRYSRPVFGFDQPRGKEGGRLVPNDDEMEVIKRIFTLRGKGWSMKAICDDLKECGLRGKHGGHFGEATIKKILERKDLYEKYL